MKNIGETLQTLFFAGKAKKARANGQENGDRVTKKIPAKNDSEISGKSLSQRKTTKLGVLPPAFQLQDSRREKISGRLWSHWTGKKEQEVEQCYSELQTVNAGATLGIRELLNNGNQLFSCQVPCVLIVTGPKVLSDFPERISSLLEKALIDNQGIRKQLFSSDGLLKTPVLIAQNKQSVESPDALERITSVVSFYPYADAGAASCGGVLTLYIDDQQVDESKLVTGLQKGLSKAINHAENNLPDESRAIIHKHLR